jgi:hypothetical protein
MCSVFELETCLEVIGIIGIYGENINLQIIQNQLQGTENNRVFILKPSLLYLLV